MAVVHVRFQIPTADGALSAAAGSLRFTPTARRVIAGTPDTVVLPASFRVALVYGAADVTLEPTDGTWVWRVDEFLTGVPSRTVYVQVGAGAEADYPDLIAVDPATLEPAAVPEPAWVAQLALKVDTAAVGAPSGVAPLGADSKVPAAYLPDGIGGGGGPVTAANITDSTTTGRAVLTAADAPAARAAIGAGTSSLTIGTAATDAMPGNKTFTKTDVGLSNVDNTADTAKPVSTAQQTALDAKAPIASPSFTGTVSGITKTMVGLSNVDNTSDANKPVSTAQQAALVAKPTGILDGQVPVWQSSTSTWVSGLAAKVVTASGDTTGATDTPVIQAAIDAATAAGGGKVLLEGTYWINAALVLKSGVFLIGTGWSRSIINLATGANSRMLQLPTSAEIYFGVSDIKFDGYKENQTAGDAAIYLDAGTAPAGIANCQVPFFQRVQVQYAWGHGFYVGKAVEGRFYDLYAFRCGNSGIYIAGGSDRWFVQCTAGQNKNAGILHAAGNGDRFHACKSWESGKNGARGSNTISTVTAAAPNWDVSGRNHRYIDCEGQDAPAEGFIIRTKNSQFIIHSDANDGAHIRLQLAQGNDIRLLCGDGTSHGTTSDAVVNVWDTASVQNTVRATFDTYGNMTAQAIQGGGITDNNDIIIGTPGALYTTTYAATITPDPVKGFVGVTLTGNVTIANTATDRKVPGMEFDVWLTQDATGGRTVTFGTDYLGASAADTTANKVNRWRFRCRGTKWYQVSYTAY